MDINKLRYDLALQAATARLIMYGYDKTSETDCEALLGLFTTCYEQFKNLPDQEINLHFQE